MKGTLLEEARQALAAEYYAPQRALLWRAVELVDSAYGQRKFALNALDFADLEEHAIRLLRDNETLRSRVKAGFDEILIATCPRRELEGLSLATLARGAGTTPAEAMLNLLLEEKATVSMVAFSQSPDNVAKVLAHPAIMVGSDSIGLSAGPGPHPGKPHPRMYGTFPRVLGLYAREQKLFSLETAVQKMTGLCAARLRLPDRGVIRPGSAADLAIFDPETVRDEATFADPHRHPTGIPYVVVNGAVAVDGGRFTATGTGRVLAP